MFGHGESVVLHRYLGQIRNASGQTVKQFADDMSVHGVAVAPGGGSEPSQGLSYRVVSKMTIYVPSSVSISPQDEVTVRGKRYGVDGDASGGWVSPFTGWSPGSAVTLKRVTG